MLQGFERCLAPGLLVLELDPQDFPNANANGRGATPCSLDAEFLGAGEPPTPAWPSCSNVDKA